MGTRIDGLRVGNDCGPASGPVQVGGHELPGVELGTERGVPVHLNVRITVADCWVEGHLLTLEIVGPDGQRLVPGRRVVLGAGQPATGALTVSTRLGFVPQRIGPHALYVHLDRKQAGGVRFLVREPRRH